MVTTAENSDIEVSVLGNDSDLEQDTLSVVSATTPLNGSAVISVDDTIVYTPDLNFFGTDSFEYTISDGTDTATATVVVTVTFVNVGPLAANDQLTVTENTSAEFDLLTNDSDGDGDPLTIVNISDPSNGTVVVLSLIHI